MLNLNTILIGTENAKELGEFYKKVLDMKANMQDDGFYGFKVGSTWLAIMNHSEVKGESKNPQRIMINFETADVAGEFDRIKKVTGAKVIKEPYEMSKEDGGGLVATFADIDGNYFQLNTPFE